MKKYTIAIAVWVLCQRCDSRQSYPPDVVSSLEAAGSNAAGLEKVLQHYRVKPEDSVKFRAACFLIANMKDHFSDKSIGKMPDLIPSSYRWLDSLTKAAFYTGGDSLLFNFAEFMHTSLDSKDFIPTREYTDSLIAAHYPDTGTVKDARRINTLFEKRVDSIATVLLAKIDTVVQKRDVFEDLRNMEAGWLIDHIDNAFRVWKSSPYARGLDFAGFSQTILTYRSRNEPPDPGSGLLAGLFKPVLFSRDSTDLASSVRRLNFYLYCLDCFEDRGRHLGNLGFYDLLQLYQYDCDRHSELTARILNACGIPAVVDFTSGYFNRDKMHFGVSVRDTAGNYHHFSPKWQPLGDTLHYKLVSKVFRRTFDRQPSPYTLRQAGEEIPLIFSDPFIKDVSDEYHQVVPVSVKIDSVPAGRNLAYLGIFTPRGWEPIGWSTFDKKQDTVHFSKVPVNSVYTAGYLLNGRLIPLCRPFRVGATGSCSLFEPDTQHRSTLVLTKKYPEKDNLMAYMQEMAGASIQGANKSDFTDARDLYRLRLQDISDFAVSSLKITDQRKYRYIRCIAAHGKTLNLATFEVFAPKKPGDRYVPCSEPAILDERHIREPDTLSVVRKKGMPIENGQQVSNAFDGDPESFVNAFSVGLDLGEAASIREIRLAARNANNGIVIGDTYQLLYYKDRWISQETQVAKYNFLVFRNVPSNGIYWLRNLDHGKEELSFVFKNGKQYFINNGEEEAFYR